MKYGLIFGSFNPIHNGHLQIALDAIQNKVVDKVYFVIAKQNPFKAPYEIDNIDRINMVSLAVIPYDCLSYNLIEFLPDTESTKTYDVYQKLKKQCNDSEELVIICGQDSYDEMSQWYCGEELLKENIYVYDRTDKDVSSALIRERIRTKEDFQDLVPKSVYNYIKKYHLYANNTKTKRTKTK